LPEEHHGSNACNDADSCPTLWTGVRGISLAAPRDAQAGTQVQTGLSSGFQPHFVGPVHGGHVPV